MIRAQGITYSVGDKYLLNDITVDFKPGIINLVIGPNGAGKSTLIKLLSGQITPVSGAVFYSGKPVKDHSIKDLGRCRAVLSQNSSLTFPLTVSEVVMMGRYPHFTGNPVRKDLQACDEAMAFLGIAGFRDRNYTSLSGGEQQRVQFARILAQIWYPEPEKTRYLLLDEPLTFLDVHYQHQFMQQIRALCSEDLVIIGVVHDLNLTAKYADNVTLLHEGKLFASGRPDVVLTENNIKAAYKLEPQIITRGDTQYIFF